MNSIRLGAGLGLAACVILSACNSTTNNPAPTPTATPQISNISGDYLGTMTDTQSGSGAASATLAQHDSSAGGAMTATLTSATITAQMSLAISSTNALTGTMVVNYANGTTCTFSTTGTYSNDGTSSAAIDGSYTAVTNCSGDTGTFTLNQQCTDTVTFAGRRAAAFPAHC